MLVRAFCVFVAAFYFSAASAADCNYGEQGGFLSRVLAVDSSGGPVYRPAKETPGTAALPSPLELRDKEVLLVFDQGPNPAFTRYILDILDRRCAKAVFFFAGNAALASPDSVRDVARRGHTIAAGTWSTAPNLASMSNDGAQAEIEKGFAAVAKASGGEVAPFFSAPGQSLPPATLDYLKERGVSLWPVDVVSGDIEPGLTPSKFANRTIERLHQAGKGIIEFHDTRKVTVDALDSILVNLKAEGFKLVQILPAGNFAPKNEYLAAHAETPAAMPTAFAASPSSGAFVEEAKRQVRQAETEARQVAEQQRRVAAERQEAAERQRIAAARQEAGEQRRTAAERQEAAERQRIAAARQEAAERRARQEGMERRARQETAERQSQTRYSERRSTTRSIWEEPRETETRRSAEDRQAAAERRTAAERQAQARSAEWQERRTAQLRQEAALRRARQEAAERRAQARNAEIVERRRTAQRPD